MAQKYPIDCHNPGDIQAIHSLNDTAADMLRDVDAGFRTEELPHERLDRLERMICLLILRES